MRVLRAVLLAGLLAISPAGCGSDDGDQDALEPELSAPPEPSGYAAAVNARCGELDAATFKITDGAKPTAEVFRKNQAKLDALTAEFDADVAKIPVTTDADRKAAAAFAAFQKFSDTEWGKVEAAAAAGDEAKFQTAFQAFLDSFDASPIPAGLADVQIGCPAR